MRRRFGGLVAVDDLSFDLAAGEVLGIIGPNGAGKTTSFNLIAGSEQPDSGSIEFFGEDVTALPAHERARRGLARTFQLPQPLGDLSVRDNILVGALLRHDVAGARRRADEILALCRLEDLADVPADRLNTASGKRLELGRALATQPRLLLLDEPVAGLNESELHESMAIIDELIASGITIIIIEHVLKAIFRQCSRVIVLNFGATIADGTPQQVRQDPRVIEAYLGDDGH